MAFITTNSSSLSAQASPAKKLKRNRRRVSFHNMAEVYVVESTCSTEEGAVEPNELWYTARDFKRFKKQCLASVKRKLSPDNAKYTNADAECRGLERLMDPMVTKALVTNALRAVTREQIRIRMDGDEGEESDLILAEVYSAYSRHSTIRAKRLGLFDAKQARNAIRSQWTEQPAKEEEKEQAPPSPHPPKKQSSLKNLLSKESRQPKSARCGTSSERLPLQENIKATLNNMVTRRNQRAWI